MKMIRWKMLLMKNPPKMRTKKNLWKLINKPKCANKQLKLLRMAKNLYRKSKYREARNELWTIVKMKVTLVIGMKGKMMMGRVNLWLGREISIRRLTKKNSFEVMCGCVGIGLIS